MQRVEKPEAKIIRKNKTCNVCRQKDNRYRDRKQAEHAHVYHEVEQIERKNAVGVKSSRKLRNSAKDINTCM